MKFEGNFEVRLLLDAIKVRFTRITKEKLKEVDHDVVANLHLAMANTVLSSVVEKNTTKEI